MLRRKGEGGRRGGLRISKKVNFDKETNLGFFCRGLGIGRRGVGMRGNGGEVVEYSCCWCVVVLRPR